jgi:hypothetical protein
MKNNGAAEFILIRDHQLPIVSREDWAGRRRRR